MRQWLVAPWQPRASKTIPLQPEKRCVVTSILVIKKSWAGMGYGEGTPLEASVAPASRQVQGGCESLRDHDGLYPRVTCT